jgi:hypothetical protein
MGDKPTPKPNPPAELFQPVVSKPLTKGADKPTEKRGS